MSNFKLSSLSEDVLNDISSSLDSNSVFGVIGVCGIVGNLVARVLLDNGFKVLGTDMTSKEDCVIAASNSSIFMNDRMQGNRTGRERCKAGRCQPQNLHGGRIPT